MYLVHIAEKDIPSDLQFIKPGLANTFVCNIEVKKLIKKFNYFRNKTN